MADVTVSATVQFTNPNGDTRTAQVAEFLATLSDKLCHLGDQEIGTSEEAVNLGGLSSVGWCLIKNSDPTNYVELKTGTGGTVFAKLPPDTNQDGNGGVALLYLGSGAQAPYAIANSNPCVVSVFVVAQ